MCAKGLTRRSLQALAAFAKGLKAKHHEIDIELDVEPEPGLADSGDLESDLLQLLETVGEAAKRAGSALVLCIDDLQFVEERQLGALLGSLHRANQDELPVMLICAGIPQLRGRVGNAKPYAERLFEFHVVGASR